MSAYRWLMGALGVLLAALAALAVAQVAAPGPAAPPAAAQAGRASAIFAGGCFWCVEADFEKLPGVISAESGYMRGKVDRPTYKQVSAGGTGHVEVVRVVFDPARVSYQQLLEHFWRNIDPTVKDQQFCDVGDMYRSGIYFLDAAQQRAAEASRSALVASKRFSQIHTEIESATTFWPAEDYHQDYYKKNPVRYKLYRSGCGRDARLAELWGTR
ncbi:MAG: peptide-methionine (S)-S-oxide reductase MsrA [Betaproteobacteria bacterium]|jgi:peptide-methionine (S)-S-oxide reductase|nr:peptide-methionine (S)-S-oxide reductase MsrA [Betaproteobacteria bacterium]